MKGNFENKMKTDFSVNTPDVLQKIKQDHRFKVPEKPQRSSISNIFKLRKVRFTFASLFVVVLLAVVLMNQPQEQIYASTVTLDLNPQFEITIDQDDLIIDIIALNDDGTEIIDQLGKYKRQQLNQVLIVLVDRLYENGYLSQNENTIMVYVDGVSEQVQLRIQEAVQEKLQEEATKYQKTFQFVQRNNLDYTDTELLRITLFAQENNIHPGRVIIILEILDADETYTVNDLKGLSMRELYNIYQDVTADDSQTEDPGNPGSNTNGNN